VAASGDVGYTLGHWESVLKTPAGDSVLGRGNYLTIWRRQSDGTWKVSADIGNQAAPAE
jgi:ketosteroid isomerase-like protein